MRYFNWFVILMCLAQGAHAKSLGRIGTTFEIAEEDMLVMLEAKLKDPLVQERFGQMQLDIKKKVQSKDYRPAPVKVKKAKYSRQFTFDPSTYIPNDLTDEKGQVFYQANTKVNPLETLALPAPLLFIDGDDERQVDFAKTYEGKHGLTVDLTLTSGAPFELAEKLKRPVYFDQGGYLTRHFGIEHVPAVITQQGKYLLIEEVAL